MPQYGWADCPDAVCHQVTTFTDRVAEILGANLIGVYLHGSLAMGCFNPECSDLDMLIAIQQGMSVETKRELAAWVLRCSANPIKMEMSFVRHSDIHPWQYPTPFDFHFGEDWREKFTTMLASGQWDDQTMKDPDLGAHVTIVRHRGICLIGAPIASVFPEVPRADYLDSIVSDFDWSRDLMPKNPVYTILNYCRVYWYVLESQISSKDEAGAWAADYLPPEYQPLVCQALAVYRGDLTDVAFSESDLNRFADYLNHEVKERI